MEEPLLTTSDAAQRLGLTPDAVRQMERRGRLPATRTEGGVRLFRARDVEKLARERERLRRSREDSGGVR